MFTLETRLRKLEADIENLRLNVNEILRRLWEDRKNTNLAGLDIFGMREDISDLRTRISALESSGSKVPKEKLIDTPAKRDACVKQIQKYLDRIKYLEDDPGAHKWGGPTKGVCICPVFGFNSRDENSCKKCPLGPEFMACKNTVGYMKDFNVVEKFGQDYPDVTLLKVRMYHLIEKFKEHGLDI